MENKVELKKIIDVNRVDGVVIRILVHCWIILSVVVLDELVDEEDVDGVLDKVLLKEAIYEASIWVALDLFQRSDEDSSIYDMVHSDDGVVVLVTIDKSVLQLVNGGIDGVVVSMVLVYFFRSVQVLVEICVLCISFNFISTYHVISFVADYKRREADFQIDCDRI